MKEKKNEVPKNEQLLSYYNDVVHYLRAFDIGAHLLDDAVQDTFVEAFACLHTLRDPTKMRYWVIKIAKRVGIKYVSKYKNIAIKECSFDDYVVQSNCRIETFCDSNFDRSIRGLEREELYMYINRLNDKERKTLLLYYVYGHKVKDIASILGETPSNIKSISRRAKLKLRKMIEEGGHYQ